jgi:hypothetical protein
MNPLFYSRHFAHGYFIGKANGYCRNRAFFGKGPGNHSENGEGSFSYTISQAKRLKMQFDKPTENSVFGMQ